MKILIIKPGQPQLIGRALDRMIKGLMLDRANCTALEDREASTKAVDQAVSLKRAIGEIDEDREALLIVGPGFQHFAGLAEIDAACAELFGAGLTPELLADALQAHTATLAVGTAAAVHIGGKMEAIMKAAKVLLDEYGGDVPDWLRPAATELQEAIDAAEACADAETFTQANMDAAIDRARELSPTMGAWIAAARASWDPRPDMWPADTRGDDYGEPGPAVDEHSIIPAPEEM
jgi:hypothetical protein